MNSNHTGKPSVPLTCKTQSHHRAFALAAPVAWATIPLALQKHTQLKSLHLKEAARASLKQQPQPCPSLPEQPYFIIPPAPITLWQYLLSCLSAFVHLPH